MKIKFLGTSGVQGIPVWNCNCNVCTSENSKNKRRRPVLLVEINDITMVIDFGQDFRQQLIDNGIKKIDYALLTHVHGDHMNGLEQLASQDDLKLLTSLEVFTDFTQGNSYVEWLKKRNSSIVVDVFENLNLNGVSIETVKLLHQKDFGDGGVNCTGFLFKSNNFKFAYIVDYCDIIDKEKLLGLDLIISDANNWEPTGTGHVGVKGAVNFYQELKPKQMLLTHINHRTEHSQIEEYVRKFGNISPAYDGLEINV